MNEAELSAILFYADFLSLKAVSRPVTDNCKYFYVYGIPMNSAFILNMQPEFDEQDEYYKQALAEYTIIRDKYGEEGLQSFIDDICSIRACGCVDAERMLKCIHQYSGKKERKQSFDTYNNWKKQYIFSHLTINENGDPQEKECSKYVYHAERMLGRPGLVRSIRED